MAKPQMEHVQWPCLWGSTKCGWMRSPRRVQEPQGKQRTGEELAAALVCSDNGCAVGASGATATSLKEATKQQQDL